MGLQPLTLEWMVLSLLQDLPMPGQGEASDTGTVAEDGFVDTSLLANGFGALGQTSDALMSLLAVLQSQAGAYSTPLGGTSTVLPASVADLLSQATQNNVMQSDDLTTAKGSSTSDIQALIQAASQKYGVPASLIRAVIEQESGMNPNAVSSAGALGLMQLMPETARSLGVKDPLNPAENIDGGTKYLAQLLQQFGGNTALALAAYNAGPGAVQAYGDIPPYPETEQYVSRVLQLSNQFESSSL
jgi:soluble lytic murein transglycosylase-like protein